MPRTPPLTMLYIEAPYFHTSFDPSIAGVPVITRTPTAVPASKARAIQSLALSHGITLASLRAQATPSSTATPKE